VGLGLLINEVVIADLGNILRPVDSKGPLDTSTPYIWWYSDHLVPYMGVILSTVSIFSMLWYPFCTGIAPEYEGGKAACVLVHEEYLLSYTSTCSVESGIQCDISIA
jgi:hypothetical protein